MKFRIIKSIYWEGPKPFPKERRMFLKKEKNISVPYGL